MNPPAEYGEEPRDPFGFFDGCIVKYKQKKVAGYPNMDDTLVEASGDLYDGDEDKLMAVLEEMVDLNEFLDESKFKSEAELQTRLNKVLGENAAPRDEEEVEQVAKETGTEYGGSSKMDALRKKAAKPAVEDGEVEAPKPTKKAAPKQEEEEDDDLAFFRSLADE